MTSARTCFEVNGEQLPRALIDVEFGASGLPFPAAVMRTKEGHDSVHNDEHTVQTDRVVYSEHHGKALKGMLYRPAGGARCPVVIAVHGGGWKQGSPQRYEHWGKWLASRGIALYAIEYRLANRPEHRFPAPVQDVIAAIGHIRQFSKQLNVDPDRIALMGDSAGAHLVTWVALAGNSLMDGTSAESAAIPKLCAVIGVYGVYDMLAQWEHDQIARPRDHVTEALMGFSLPENRLAYFHASPVAHASIQAPRQSFLIAWGADDDVVDWASQSGRFVTALKQSGQFVRTVPIVGAPHLWIDQPMDEQGSFTGFLAPKLHRFLLDRFAVASPK